MDRVERKEAIDTVLGELLITRVVKTVLIRMESACISLQQHSCQQYYATTRKLDPRAPGEILMTKQHFLKEKRKGLKMFYPV